MVVDKKPRLKTNEIYSWLMHTASANGVANLAVQKKLAKILHQFDLSMAERGEIAAGVKSHMPHSPDSESWL